MKNLPPPPIMAAIAAMLQPYGIDAQKLLQEEDKSIKSNQPQWLSPRTIEERYCLGRWSIYRLIRSGNLKSSKLSSAKSGKVLVDADSLRNYLASKEYIPEAMNSVTTHKEITGEAK